MWTYFNRRPFFIDKNKHNSTIYRHNKYYEVLNNIKLFMF